MTLSTPNLMSQPHTSFRYYLTSYLLSNTTSTSYFFSIPSNQPLSLKLSTFSFQAFQYLIAPSQTQNLPFLIIYHSFWIRTSANTHRLPLLSHLLFASTLQPPYQTPRLSLCARPTQPSISSFSRGPRSLSLFEHLRHLFLFVSTLSSPNLPTYLYSGSSTSSLSFSFLLYPLSHLSSYHRLY